MPENGILLEHSDVHLTNVHSPQSCLGEYCTIHNRSDHHMRLWPQHWRSDRGIIERICPHGVGHPDPDSPWFDDSYEWVHGCDGCCLIAPIELAPPNPENRVDTRDLEPWQFWLDFDNWLDKARAEFGDR